MQFRCSIGTEDLFFFFFMSLQLSVCSCTLSMCSQCAHMLRVCGCKLPSTSLKGIHDQGHALMKAYRSAAHLSLCSSLAFFTSSPSAGVYVRMYVRASSGVANCNGGPRPGRPSRSPRVMDAYRSAMSDMI